MKVTFIAHASILIETSGLRILSDPWWKGPCFGTQWWVYPGPNLAPIEDQKIDYIYVSHGHHDHFHPGTLRTLPRTAKVLVAKGFDIAPAIRNLGFEVIEIAIDQEYALNDSVKVRIMPTYHDDSLMALTDGKETCLNLNDALHSAPATVQDDFIARLRSFYPQGINYVFCGYGIASHFPNCYVIPGKDPAASAGARQKYFNRNWAKIINGLSPRFGFPFAADVVFLDNDLFWANEPVHNTERPTDALRTEYPSCPPQVLDIAPGFVIEDGTVKINKLREPISSERLRSELPEDIEKANRVAPVSREAVEDLADLVRRNIQVAEPFLSSYPGDYNCLVEIRNAPRGIQVLKRQARFTVITSGNLSHRDYDVVYTTRFPYLKNSLVTEYGSEVLFVGSGGIFEYRDREAVPSAIHRELMQIVKRQTSCPPPRYGGSSRLLYETKQTVKEILGLKTRDLYDLNLWTVYEEDSQPAHVS